MNFKRLMLLLSAAVAVVAFSAPAAQAQTLYEGTSPSANDAEVTATSTNLVTVSPLGTLECELVTLHITITDNQSHPTTGTDAATTVSECNKNISTQTSGSPTLSTGGTGVAAGATFVVEAFCDYSGNIPFSWESGSDVLTVTGEEQFSSSFCGKGTMTGTFTLET